jgi:uncharacterized protein (TIGR02996 family)
MTAVPPLPAPYLRQILAHPDDDGPRLVAADWWDEQGAAGRAEFIRVQCELARRYPGWSGVPAMGSLGAGGPYAELRRRERGLWRAGGDTDGRGWFAGCGLEGYVIYLVPSTDNMTAVVRRGFVEELTAPAADFLRHADALTAACPLRRVRLTTWPEVWAAPRDPRKQVKTDADAVFGFGPARLGGMYAAAINPGSTLVDQLLTERFPGIDFELPPIADVWHVPRGADPRPIAAPHEGTRG